MKLLQRYKPSPAHTVVYAFAIIVTLAALALLAYANFSGNFSIAEDGQSLISKGFFVLIVLLASFVFFFIRHTRKNKFKLYETGIQVNSEPIIPFENISDVYLFLSGRMIGNGYNNLAFRTSENDPWFIISAKYSGKLEEFLNHYFPKRLAYVQSKMEQGNAVKFYYLTRKNANAFGVGASSFVKNLQTAPIVLKSNSITINEQVFNYHDLKPLYLEHANFQIKTTNSQVLASFGYVDMMSFDVFREIYNQKTTPKNDE